MNSNPEDGFGSAAEYQSSGLPWVTSSVGSAQPQRWSFPKVTRCVTVRNVSTSSGGPFIVVGFTQNGVMGSNRFIVPPNQQELFEVRCKELWVMGLSGSADYSIFAALTTVPAKSMPLLTGSYNGVAMWDGVG